MPSSLPGLPEVKLAAIEVVRVELEMVKPFRTAHGIERHRTVLLVRAIADNGAGGWGECSALSAPSYNGEWIDGAEAVLNQFLVPAALANEPAAVVGHPMANSALEVAITQLRLQSAGLTLASWLGAVRDKVPCGVAVGISETIDALVEEVGRHLQLGYQRVKLKVCPGWDLEPVLALRSTWPELALGVDANGSYVRSDLDGTLSQLDALGLVEIEQPFAPDDLLSSAEAVARLETPICLDESITSAHDLEVALKLKACDHVNLKPARVGGIAAGKAIYDLAVANGVPLWVGAMLETGIGKEVAVAFAALEGTTLPGDLTPSKRWYSNDITSPWEMNPDGTMPVRTSGPILPGVA